MERDGKIRVITSRYDAAWSVLYRLQQAGYQAYLVGGCVRDMLLGLTPADFDVATDALPETVRGLFERTVPTGLQHGTISVLIGNERVEVTTFRVEGKYSDARRPANVQFVKTLEADLSRRDFTINAMAMDRRGIIYDPFDGKLDLQNKQIRAVGNPENRFREDALRMLRAIRFASVLDASIEEQTWHAINRHASRIAYISRERIREEWNKVVLSNFSLGMKLLIQSSLVNDIFPEFLDQPSNSLLDAADFACRLPEKLALRYAAFYSHLAIGETEVRTSLLHLRQPNRLIRNVLSILRAIPADDPLHWTPFKWRQFLYNTGDETAFAAFLILGYSRHDQQNLLMQQLQEAIDRQTVWSQHDLAVTGSDLIRELRIPPGPFIGKLLQELVLLVLGNPALNTKQALLSAAASFYYNKVDK